MRISLIAVGTRMPAWVNTGFDEYASRLPQQCRLELNQIALGHRGKSAAAKSAIATEGERMLAATQPSDRVIALEVTGKAWSTERLATEMQAWLADGCDLALLVGGPDGLAPACQTRADSSWSLSALTLPHGLVRIIVAEQIYRAWSLLQGHPYHRA